MRKARSSIAIIQLRGTKLLDIGQHTWPIERSEIGPRSHQYLAISASTTRWVVFPSQKQNPVIALGYTPLKVVLFETAVSQPLLDLIKWILFPFPCFNISAIIAAAPGWAASRAGIRLEVSRNLIQRKEVKAVYGITALIAETTQVIRALNLLQHKRKKKTTTTNQNPKQQFKQASHFILKQDGAFKKTSYNIKLHRWIAS